MKFIADLHIHSKYSRATSKSMDLESLDFWAKIKGIKVLGTGDFTHPEWFKGIKNKLVPAEKGLFKLEKNSNNTRFLLTAEISCIYSKNGKVRKIHLIVFAPSIAVAEKINARLGSIGNIKSDGRPILGLDAKELAKMVFDASRECMVIPAHAWTPWFGLFGSKSGFDSLEECFEEYSKEIYAIETGLSSDPLMNWQWSALDKICLISNSDSHSAKKIGREANVFDTELNYASITDAIKQKDPKKFLYTIEFYPEEGKYHLDGHRLCEIRLLPKETRKYNGICPVCGKPLTVGVLNRIADLADRKEGFVPKNTIPFKSLVPLEEIIADVLKKGVETKAVEEKYTKLVNELETEFNVLLDAPKEMIKKSSSPEIARAITKVRKGEVYREAGYDGVFGKISVFDPGKKEKQYDKQNTLF